MNLNPLATAGLVGGVSPLSESRFLFGSVDASIPLSTRRPGPLVVPNGARNFWGPMVWLDSSGATGTK